MSIRNTSNTPIGAAIAAGVAVGVGMLCSVLGLHAAATIIWAAAALVALGFSGASVLRQLWRRQPGVDVIALLALIGTLAVGESLAGAVVAAMLASGRALEAYAQGRAQRELHSLLSRAPQIAHKVMPEGLCDVPLSDIGAGDLIVVRPGEVVPVDGVVVDAAVIIDESALTGEALPVDRAVGDKVRSGTVNAGSSARLRALDLAANSTYAGIIKLVASARSSQAPMARLADAWAAWFAAFTIVMTVAIAIVTRDPHRVVAVLVVATPCPLLLAVPVALISGMSSAAARGIVVKGAASLEQLSRADTLLVDKTGTLTSGRAGIRDIEAPGQSADAVLAFAASAEQHSGHVLAASIVNAALARGMSIPLATGAHEDMGQGIVATVDGAVVRVGRLTWITADPPAWVARLSRRCALDGSTLVAVARDGTLIGALVLDDFVRPESARTLRRLREQGIRRIVMVTGDRADIASPIGATLGVDTVIADCSPEGKVDAVRNEHDLSKRGVIMIGDGINDAAALAAADVGVALGARGSSASSEAADIVITVDQLDRLGIALGIAKRTRSIATQSVVVGMGLSVFAMIAASYGFLTPAVGAFLQEVIDVVAILSALRALGGFESPKNRGEVGALTARFRGEHEVLRGEIERIRWTADALEDHTSASDIEKVRELHRYLVEKVLVHERAEETDLYPVIARLLGGNDPTGPMSRGHAEIERFIRLLGLTLEEVKDADPTPTDLVELRRLLYGLYAILRLHTAQEDEAYLSLAEPNVAR